MKPVAGVQKNRYRAFVLLLSGAVAISCDPVGPRVPLSERDLTIEPLGASIEGVGGQQAFRLVDENGAVVPDDSVTWFSFRPHIASLDGHGRATGFASGQAVIGAKIGETELAYAVVTVSVPVAPATRWSSDTIARPRYRAAWAGADDDVFIGGDDGALYHFDGTRWTGMESGTRRDIVALAGVPGGRVFALTWESLIRHVDGAWTEVPTDGPAEGLWVDSMGRAYTAVWGVVSRYDGTTWDSESSADSGQAQTLWGSSPSDLFAANTDGGIYHYDGEGWTRMENPTGDPVYALWGTGPADAYAGARSSVLHYDGHVWSQAWEWDSGVDALAGHGSDEVWGLSRFGPYFVYFNGNGWHQVHWPSIWPGASTSLYAIACSPAGTVYAVGSDGLVVTHAPDATELLWSRDNVGAAPTPVTALWGLTPFDVFALTDEYVFRRGSAGAWADEYVDGPGFGLDYVDVWAAGPDDVFAVSAHGGVFRWNGSTWKGGEMGTPWLEAAWGAGPNAVFVVGYGKVLKYDGQGWSGRSFPVDFHDVWGTAVDNVYAASSAGIYRYNGGHWASERGTGRELNGIWGTSPNDIFAVGDSGRVVHYDGSDWTDMAAPTAEDLNAVWGTAPGNVYAVGDGVILHYDGAVWSVLDGAPAADYHSIWGSSFGPFYFGAEGQVIEGYR